MSDNKKVRWTIASARQNLSKLVDLAAREPQPIYRRDTLVARVVGADPATAPAARPSARSLLEDLKRACVEEKYDLPTSPRVSRPNAFVEGRAQRSGDKRRKAPPSR